MTITQEAIDFIKANPMVLERIAKAMGKSFGTVYNWAWKRPHLFTRGSSIDILCEAMGKTIEEITTEKTEA